MVWLVFFSNAPHQVIQVSLVSGLYAMESGFYILVSGFLVSGSLGLTRAKWGRREVFADGR